MAGLSMGGMETHSITMAHLDTFAYIGLFSGGSITTNEISNLAGSTNAVANMAAFKKKVKLVFISSGSRELGSSNGRGGGRGGGGLFGDPRAATDGLKAAGINAVFFVSPNTAHEFLSWRRSLYNFAPLLFQNP